MEIQDGGGEGDNSTSSKMTHLEKLFPRLSLLEQKFFPSVC